MGPEFLLLDCKNISATVVEKCEAFIVSVRHETPNGEVHALQIDAIPLPWMPIEKDKIYQTSIPSSGHRNLLVLQRIQDKVYFHTDNLPANYIHTFIADGIFFVTLMVCPYGAATVPFSFKLITGSPPSIEPISEG
jgi:hypothetical protein